MTVLQWPTPPCKAWGRYARGGPNPRAKRREIGDDGGCFSSALETVRRVGGVIEHPEATHAYAHFNITRPSPWTYGGTRGWERAACGGWVCCVSQANYGHRSRKLTWLYLYGYQGDPPPLDWAVPPRGACVQMERSPRSAQEGVRMTAEGFSPPRIKAAERLGTPAPFAKVLIALAAGCSLP